MNDNMFNKGLDRFNKTSLIKEEVIGNEKIIFEKGLRLVLCSYYKKDCIEENIDINETVIIYRIERSLDGYYDGTFQYHFTDKERAKVFYQHEKMKMIIENNEAINSSLKKDKEVSSHLMLR